MTHQSSPHGIERRRHFRLEHNVPVKISSEDVDIVTETTNLSCSGAYCRVAKYIAPMTKLKINLLLPMGKTTKSGKLTTKRIACQGVVVRTETVAGQDYFNTAIFFSDIASRDSQIISDFVQEFVDQKKQSA